MNYEQKLLVGRALKALMQSYGRKEVFQNNYRTGTRTVKCYSSHLDANTVLNLRDSVHRLMSAFGVEIDQYDMKLTTGTRYGGPGIIVKF